ncbi:MAG TPA: prepilin-type N-terminal cleavage/methylation domain-containing protein [Patescibacteria group bacterium]|nr:prepilin-type N-terminal cleavage/methylation domain-containing protein [Patescibacteria group bacterium]
MKIISKDKSVLHSGFTLVEILVAISVFAIASVVIAGIFLNITGLQQNTASTQRLQNDARYILEKIAREVRSREIDYPLSNPQTYVYFRKDELGGYLYVCFDSANNNLKYYVSPTGDSTNCIVSGEPINASDVKVNNVQFYVQPTAEDQWGEVPATNIQPRVTILLELENRNINERYKEVLTVQTTVSSKLYKK